LVRGSFSIGIAQEISIMTPRPIQPMMPPQSWNPTADRAQMIAQWYEHYLRREPDAQGFRNWMAQLNTTTPEVALAGILGSDEYYRLWGATDANFVAGLYADILGRQADPAEAMNWVQVLASHHDRARLAYDFMMSAQAELAHR
jgi:hypothetical protein